MDYLALCIGVHYQSTIAGKGNISHVYEQIFVVLRFVYLILYCTCSINFYAFFILQTQIFLTLRLTCLTTTRTYHQPTFDLYFGESRLFLSLSAVSGEWRHRIELTIRLIFTFSARLVPMSIHCVTTLFYYMFVTPKLYICQRKGQLI